MTTPSVKASKGPRLSLVTASDPSHDFDFIFGRWKIENERLLERLASCSEWETFDAMSVAMPVLGGRGNVDEYTAIDWPARPRSRPHAQQTFVGMSLRLYDPQTRKWSIHWADNATCALQPPVIGGFEDGVGVFEGKDVFEGRPIVVRYVWSEITSRSAKWEQFFSPDEGATWEKNWVMYFTRVDD